MEMAVADADFCIYRTDVNCKMYWNVRPTKRMYLPFRIQTIKKKTRQHRQRGQRKRQRHTFDAIGFNGIHPSVEVEANQMENSENNY